MSADKYRIEIERISDGPRPWEWRVYISDADEPEVAGSRPTAARALDEAVITLNLMVGEK